MADGMFLLVPGHSPGAAPASVGHKANGLWDLVELGMPVPAAWVLLNSQQLVHATESDARSWVDALLDAAPGRAPLFAVRASSDRADHGQHPTYLHVGALVDGAPDVTDEAWWIAAADAWAWSNPADEPRIRVEVRALEGTAPRGSTGRDRVMQWAGEHGWTLPGKSVASHVAAAVRAVARTGVPAVIVQAMVDGARGGAGVATSHDTHGGARGLRVEFIAGQAGDALTMGRRSPGPQDELPDAARHALATMLDALVGRFRSPQELEFTVEDGALHVLQRRDAVMGAVAAARAGVELVDAGVASRAEALEMVPLARARDLSETKLVSTEGLAAVARGVPASVGVGVGTLVFHAEAAVTVRARGGRAVLLCAETRPEDLPGVRAAAAVVTARGGTTSHAAVMARAMGVPCVVGCSDVRVDAARGRATLRSGATLEAGVLVTVNAHTGEVWEGEGAIRRAPRTEQTERLLAWAREAASLRVSTVPPRNDVPVFAVGERAVCVRAGALVPEPATVHRLVAAGVEELVCDPADETAWLLSAARNRVP